MTQFRQRVNYDLIAHLYDEPGRDYSSDLNLETFLEQRTHKGLRVLDMGCGTGKQLAANHKRHPEFRYAGLDLFRGMLHQAHKRCSKIRWVQGDSSTLPFANNSFDYITNQFSYHHVQNKTKMLAEAYRVLRPGGRFVITNLDPWSMPEWIVYTYFPTSRERDFNDFLRVDGIKFQMEKMGFCNIHVQREHSKREENLNDFFRYASQRYRTSQLIGIQDQEYEDGIVRLKENVAKLGNDFRVSSEICLVWVAGDKSE